MCALARHSANRRVDASKESATVGSNYVKDLYVTNKSVAEKQAAIHIAVAVGRGSDARWPFPPRNRKQMLAFVGVDMLFAAKLHDDAKCSIRSIDGSAGFDVASARCATIPPGNTARI